MTKPKWYERPGNRQQLLERIEALEGLIREGRIRELMNGQGEMRWFVQEAVGTWRPYQDFHAAIDAAVETWREEKK